MGSFRLLADESCRSPNLVTVATHRLARLVGHAEPSVPSRVATFIGVTVTSVYIEPVRLGSVTCAITLLPGTWRGTYVAGELRLTLGLHLGINVLRGAEDSDITLTLTTASLGSRAGAEGRIAVSGTATFQKGYLGGRLATMVVNGAISPALEMGSRRSVA